MRNGADVSYQETLPGNLVLRSLHGEQDIGRFAQFNGRWNNEDEGRTCACFLRQQPGRTLDDAWLIEDLNAQETVATVCLIPWTFRYGDVLLRVAMLEMVLAHPGYRGRGLVRTLVQRFHARVTEQAYDLCVIWGIPFFYRQFGYGYAIDGDRGESLPARQIPDGTAAAFLRRAETTDIPLLQLLYAELVKPLALTVARDAAYWEYLLRHAQHPFELLIDGSGGEARGYASIFRSAQRAHVLESSLPTISDAMALLRLAKQETVQEVRVAGPADSTLATLVRGLGSQAVPGGQWLWRIPDLPQLLARIAPVLAARLAASPWRGLSGNIILNTYRAAYRLTFAAGSLAHIDVLGFVDSSMGADGGDLCLPPDALLRLVLGYRRLDELVDAWPDISCKPEKRTLIDTLFPPMSAFVYTPYHYLGRPEGAA
jgi:predicted N-acetyltransferase YhbS